MEAITKPKVKLTGQNDNIFNLIGICQRALEAANQKDAAKEMTDKCFKAKSYDEAIQIMGEYCQIS